MSELNTMNRITPLQGRKTSGRRAVTRPFARASLASVLAWSLFAAVTPAAADHHGGGHTSHAAAQAKDIADEFVNAEVRKIDKEGGKLTLKHEAIRKFDMAGMTMVFRVADPALLDGLAVGDRVRFMPDKHNGQFVVTRIEKQDPQ